MNSKIVFIFMLSVAASLSLPTDKAVGPEVPPVTEGKASPTTTQVIPTTDSKANNTVNPKPEVPPATNKTEVPATNKTVPAKEPQTTEPTKEPTSTPKTETTAKVTTTETSVKTTEKSSTSQETTAKPEVTTAKTTEEPKPDDKHSTVQARGFDGPSFIGGIILTLGLLAVGFMGFKYYKNHAERNYHTL